MITTLRRVCLISVEVCRQRINKKYGTQFNIPVVYYSQLMMVAYGGNAMQAGLNGQIIRAKKLEEVAEKQACRNYCVA